MTRHQQPSAPSPEAAVRPETAVARAGVATDPGHGAVAPALHLSATYAWASPLEKPAYDYARSGNPTRGALEEAIADLEGAARAVVTGSGMSAVDLVLALVKPGERVIAPHDCYGGTYRLLKARHDRGHFEVVFVDQTDDAALEAALSENTALVLIETPSNPLLRITDLAKVSAAAHRVGALAVADNTFLSPVLQRPLDFGCDAVIHSTTKYLNGHTDVIGGAVAARDAALGEELVWWANATGVTGPAFDSYQTLRGLRTLYLRVERQAATAERLAPILAHDERIARVHYPGLADHPGHALAKRQQKGFGAMLSLELDTRLDPVVFLQALKHFTIAESLGGFESLVCAPAFMTHASMDAAARAAAGIADGLIRLSIGVEHREDLIGDLLQALDAAETAKSAATRRAA